MLKLGSGLGGEGTKLENKFLFFLSTKFVLNNTHKISPTNEIASVNSCLLDVGWSMNFVLSFQRSMFINMDTSENRRTLRNNLSTRTRYVRV